MTLPPPQRVTAAIDKMKAIGINSQTTKSVLKKLLRVFENKWEYIEAENYRALADAIMEMQESMSEGSKRKKHDDVDDDYDGNDLDWDVGSRMEEAAACDEPELYRKRLRGRQEEQCPSASCRNSRAPIIPHSSNLVLKAPMIESTLEMPDQPVVPMDEFEASIAMFCPPQLTTAGDHQDQPSQAECSLTNHSTRQTNATNTVAALHAERRHGKESVLDATCRNGTTSELASVQDRSSTIVEIASSAMGEVKLSFTCSSAPPDCPNFSMPSIEAVCKVVEDRCLRSCKILLMNLLKEMCQCVLELGSQNAGHKQENVIKIIPALESLKKSGVHNILSSIRSCSSNGSSNLDASQLAGLMAQDGLHLNQEVDGNDENGRNKKKIESRGPEPSNTNPHSLVVVQQPQLALGDIRPQIDANDITKGEERVGISVVNEVSSVQYLPSFHYIPHNIIYQNAYVNISLARIGDDYCCSDCFGDCMMASIPCACARETGGEYAYTSDGLVKGDFLDTCISRYRNPQKDHLYYCQDCPVEKIKNEVMPEPCKGHLIKKFIKECWSKCGCNKQCGNRVVQRGITCNLQVFYTREGKGWGLRTLDGLPKGTFVCEYVGEILTNMELYERTLHTTGDAEHTYPVTLDADWGSEGVLKDEDALCLDATFYGNAARFINHRCSDANLVEIPVEIETPDHHYYHIAFFTARRVEAFEELNWDYGIDFDDHNHPIKAFQCCCGSKFCRDMNRSKTKSGALVMR